MLCRLCVENHRINSEAVAFPLETIMLMIKQWVFNKLLVETDNVALERLCYFIDKNVGQC